MQAHVHAWQAWLCALHDPPITRQASTQTSARLACCMGMGPHAVCGGLCSAALTRQAQLCDPCPLTPLAGAAMQPQHCPASFGGYSHVALTSPHAAGTAARLCNPPTCDNCRWTSQTSCPRRCGSALAAGRAQAAQQAAAPPCLGTKLLKPMASASNEPCVLFASITGNQHAQYT